VKFERGRKMRLAEKILNEEIKIRTRRGIINGLLDIPEGAKGIIIFAHGSGSGRLSPRNRHVAGVLNQEKLATLLMDLLTEREEQIDSITGELRFDIDFLARRLNDVTEWVLSNDNTRMLQPAYFGASTGAAAALKASVQRPETIKALVSRGGRPDMAEDILSQVTTPVLLIVGGDDAAVLEMNRRAFEKLAGEKKLVVVPGATHLFEEPGKLDEVADHAAKWFLKHLS
jgi:putative phosphoribosyl transferase